MEAARLGLGEYPLSALGRSHASAANHQAALAAAGLFSPNQAALSLMDPWLAASPLLGSTLSHALPGFLSHSQTCYPSYLTPPTTSSPVSIFNAAHHNTQHQTTLIDGRHSVTLKTGSPLNHSISHSQVNGISEELSKNELRGGSGSPEELRGGERTSSIVNLRTKAKEHMESLSKGIQTT